MTTERSPWSYWLEDYPGALFGASIPKGTPSFQDYWQRQMSKVTGEYQTALGRQAISGQPPSLTFGDFLGDYPWARNFYQLSAGQRGLNQGLSPSLQWRV